jgi:hypothetical protein
MNDEAPAELAGLYPALAAVRATDDADAPAAIEFLGIG